MNNASLDADDKPTAANRPLVEVEQAGKKFCRDLKRSLWYGVKDMAGDLFRSSRRMAPLGEKPSLRKDEFWAAQDVSFSVRRGECIGLIGHNGAGKTTVLKMLNGLIKPDVGRVTMRGQVGAMIALGAGFNPVLTGRENIYVNGSVLGLSRREIDAKLQEIIDFAEIGTSIDSPVRNYSSGMQVRLGFAVAVVLIQPDVLLLDEVLAVGDAGFRHKCYKRIGELQQNAAVILVSHSMGHIAQMCDRVAFMNNGQMTVYEDVVEAIDVYNKCTAERSASEGKSVHTISAPIMHAEIRAEQDTYKHGDMMDVILQIESEAEVETPNFSFVVKDAAERSVLCWNTTQFDQIISIPRGSSEIRFRVGPLYLHAGNYNCDFSVADAGSIHHIIWIFNQVSFSIHSDRRPLGNIPFIASYQGHTVVPSDS